jgi:SpoVK/Ycf46/Vps4 family AAA+-type ATPase
MLEIDLPQLTDQLTPKNSAQGGAESSDSAAAGHAADEDNQSPAEQTASEVLDRVRQPERTLDELHGKQLHDELDAVIRNLELALELSDHPAYDHRNIGNVLFTGPPGTGKTTAAEGVAKALSEGDHDFQFLPIKGHHFKNHLLGASEGAVEEIFQRADDMGPTLIFIDEFEEVTSRDGDQHEVTQAITNTLLSLLSGGQAVENVALVGATNRPDKVDKAIKSRFNDNIIEFTEPPEHIKHEILLGGLEGDGVILDCSRQELASLSYNGLVGRELETAARNAIGIAADRRDKKPYRVTFGHVQQAVTAIQEQQDRSLASQ